MKSSYVLILVFFVILVSATVIAKLASHIQLAPHPIASMEPKEKQVDLPEPKADPQPVERVEIGKAVQDGWIRITAGDDATLLVSKVAIDQTESQPNISLNIPVGTAFDFEGETQFVAANEQQINLTEEPASVSVLSCRMESTLPVDSELQVTAEGLNWASVMQSDSFRAAPVDIRKYAVWALSSRIGLADLQPLLTSEPGDSRLTLKSLSTANSFALSNVVTESGVIEPTDVPLLVDLRRAQAEADVVAAIKSAYAAFDKGDHDNVAVMLNEAEDLQAELKSESPLIVEVGSIKTLDKLRALADATPTVLPSVLAEQLDSVISQLAAADFPVQDIESRFEPVLKTHVTRCLERIQLGQVFALNERLQTPVVDSDTILKLRSIETEILAIFERHLSKLEDDEILPTSTIDEAKMTFVPNEDASKRLGRLSGVTVESISKSKRRDVSRQMSEAYLEMAESAVKNDLKAIGIHYAKQALAQQAKARGVSGKAERLLRVLEADE